MGHILKSIFGLKRKIKRVLLLDKPWDGMAKNKYDFGLPIPILDLAPFLRQRGMEVRCANFFNLPKYECDIVGLSSLFRPIEHIIEDFMQLRSFYPGSKFILGGKIARSLSEQEKNRLLKKKIEICNGPGETFFFPDETYSLKDYPSWNFQDIADLGYDAIHRWCNLMSSRGCPYRCNFCNNTEKKVQYFDIERTIDNINLLFKLKRKYVNFGDDIFTLKPERMQNIFDCAASRKIDLQGRVRFFTHIRHINEECVKACLRYKPIHVSVGVESGDERMLSYMGKGFKPELAKEKVIFLSKYVRVHALFLVGFPGETIDSLENTYNFVKSLSKYNIFSSVNLYQPIPYTVGYELSKQRGQLSIYHADNHQVSYIPEGLNSHTLKQYRQKILSLNR